MSAAPEPTEEQKQLVELARILQKQSNDQVRLSIVGVMGLGLLGTFAYYVWKKS